MLKRILPSSVYEKIRAVALFRPNDVNNLLQQPPQRETNVNIERIQGFRYPAPGSRGIARVPLRESEDKAYDTKQFTRDPRNVPRQNVLGINTSEGKTIAAHEVEKIGSPGQKNAAVQQYDPSGLRTSMTATWSALDAALEAEAKPNHLPDPEWFNEMEMIRAECERKGIPPQIGRRQRLKLTHNFNDVRW